tara:strand:- start:587 stop:2317 length:1731 start_codon:yes stop_codon:yes gene_type:complete
MAVTSTTVNTTDTLETLRVQYNLLNSDVVTLDNTVSSGSNVAADNITTGDAAVSIATSSGNITIDAQAGDADIIFKGTDDASDITALTLDMSAAGKAIFNGAISATTITLSADGGVIVPDNGNIGSASSTAAMQIASTGIVTFVDDILIKDGGTIGVASSASAITIASTGIVTLVDDLILKDAATIGVTSSTSAITIASTGIVTFVDDILIKDAGTIGNASVAAVMTLASTGIVTFVDDILIKDAGTIGNASVAAVMTLASTGIVTFADDILIKDAGTIGNASVAAVMTLASTGIVTFADDILIKDGGTIGNATVAAVMTLADSGIVTFADDILIKDGGTIGVASSTSAITIAATGIVTLVDDLLLKDACTIGTATTAGAIAIAADGTVDLDTAGATVASAVIKTAGLETIYVPAAAMYPTTTGGCAALAQVEGTAGRPELKCLDFDPSSDENAQFTVAFPKSWNAGTVTFRAFFTVTGTNTGTVSWSLAGGSTVDNGVIDTAFGTAVAPTAKAHSGTSNDVDVTAVSGALTIANAADDAMTFFNIERDVSADDQSADARLLGIQIFFTTSAATDA